MERVIEVLERLQPGSAQRLTIEGPPLAGHRQDRPFLMNDLFPEWKSTPLEDGLRQTVEAWKRLF